MKIYPQVEWTRKGNAYEITTHWPSNNLSWPCYLLGRGLALIRGGGKRQLRSGWTDPVWTMNIKGRFMDWRSCQNEYTLRSQVKPVLESTVRHTQQEQKYSGYWDALESNFVISWTSEWTLGSKFFLRFLCLACYILSKKRKQNLHGHVNSDFDKSSSPPHYKQMIFSRIECLKHSLHCTGGIQLKQEHIGITSLIPTVNSSWTFICVTVISKQGLLQESLYDLWQAARSEQGL